MKLWRTTDALTTEFTVSSLLHIGPSYILNSAFSVPNAHYTLFSGMGESVIKYAFFVSQHSGVQSHYVYFQWKCFICYEVIGKCFIALIQW
jgi:hypothetical protein